MRAQAIPTSFLLARQRCFRCSEFAEILKETVLIDLLIFSFCAKLERMELKWGELALYQ